MGSPNNEPGRDQDEAAHEVRISRPFLIQRTELTQAAWLALMNTNPAYFGPNGAGPNCGQDCPVERVSWNDAVTYANRLSAERELPICYDLVCNGEPGQGCPADRPNCEGEYQCNAPFRGTGCLGFRLPTEAEWEYAARAGTSTALYTGAVVIAETCMVADANADQAAWFCANSDNRTHPAANKTPNPWGLYDILGNVFEWTHDGYAENYGGLANPDGTTPVVDPIGDPAAPTRVLRGGGWVFPARFLRAANREADAPNARFRDHGFRLVRTLP